MKWISVKDRLPEKGERVLAIATSGQINIMDREEILSSQRIPNSITHWMPLPEPPKDEK